MRIVFPERIDLELAIREAIEAYFHPQEKQFQHDGYRGDVQIPELTKAIADKLEDFEEVDFDEEDDEPEVE